MFIVDVIIATLLAIFGAADAEQPAKRESLWALVGDSITWEHQDYILNHVSDCGVGPVQINARAGRAITTSETPFGYIPSGIDAINHLEATSDPSVYVIELGINDVNLGRVSNEFWARFAIESILDRVDVEDEIFWVNTYTEVGRPEDAKLFNDVLDTYDRITILDWASVASPYLYDGLHPTQGGAEVMADMYCSAL